MNRPKYIRNSFNIRIFFYNNLVYFVELYIYIYYKFSNVFIIIVSLTLVNVSSFIDTTMQMEFPVPYRGYVHV